MPSERGGRRLRAHRPRGAARPHPGDRGRTPGFRDPPHLARDAGVAEGDDDAALPFYREVRDEIETMLRAELAGLLPGVALLPL